MQSNLLRSLTALSISALSTLSAAHADEFGVPTPAPSTTPTGAASGMSDSEMRKQAALDLNAKKAMNREELAFLSPFNPFPTKEVPPVDPIKKKKFDRVVVGPAFQARGYGAGYDYYRYVTFFNVSYRKERFYELMIQRAQCYQKSEIFGNYSSSESFSASVTASASLEGLGLSASLSKSKSFGTGQGIRATGGVVADYIPYILFHDWEGQTFVQLYNSKTGVTSYLTKQTKESAWWVFVILPGVAKQRYPMPFSVKGADRTFTVDRQIVEVCDANFGA